MTKTSDLNSHPLLHIHGGHSFDRVADLGGIRGLPPFQGSFMTCQYETYNGPACLFGDLNPPAPFKNSWTTSVILLLISRWGAKQLVLDVRVDSIYTGP